MNTLQSSPYKTYSIGGKGYIQSQDTNIISQPVLQSVYEIEQDMWSHGLGSYIGCADCGEISSKTEVYGGYDTEIQKNTVAEIEAILGIPIPCCAQCDSPNTYHIYPEQYRDSNIATRFDFDMSFLHTYHDTSGEIRGFVNGYIADFDTIYEKEFAPYYLDETKQKVMRVLESKYGVDFKKPLLSLNHMGAQQGYVSLHLLYHLLKSICTEISFTHPQIDSIYDSILNNPIHGIHSAIGADRLSMTDNLRPEVISQKYPVDMMFHNRGIDTTLKSLDSDARIFFRNNLSKIKKLSKGKNSIV